MHGDDHVSEENTVGNSVVICTGANACGKVRESPRISLAKTTNQNVCEKQSVYLKQVRFIRVLFSEEKNLDLDCDPGITKTALIQLMAQVGFSFPCYITVPIETALSDWMVRGHVEAFPLSARPTWAPVLFPRNPRRSES